MYLWVVPTLRKSSAIDTSDGVKVADVVWCSAERFDLIQDRVSASIAPEFCIEVKSIDNSWDEMEFKKELYFAAQAVEVWICNEQGQITFYDRECEFFPANYLRK
jgi:Uma2 family endonuclease